MKTSRRSFLQGLVAAGVVTFAKPKLSVNLCTPKPVDAVRFDDLIAQTLRNLRPQLAATITESQVIWYQLNKSGAFK